MTKTTKTSAKQLETLKGKIRRLLLPLANGTRPAAVKGAIEREVGLTTYKLVGALHFHEGYCRLTLQDVGEIDIPGPVEADPLPERQMAAAKPADEDPDWPGHRRPSNRQYE